MLTCIVLLGIFIIGAPYFFSTVWGWIKRWFDPVTVSKIFILSDHDVLPVLTTFMDLEDIPKAYGGKLEWHFFDEPAWDDEIKRKVQWENGHTAFPPGPCYWVPTEDGTRLECLAVGTKDGKERRERVCTIPKAFLPKSATTEQTPAAAPDTTPGAPVTNGEIHEAITTREKEAVPETAPKNRLAKPEDADATTAESNADAVAGLAITDAKDSPEIKSS
jgi:hypothetical protein